MVDEKLIAFGLVGVDKEAGMAVLDENGRIIGIRQASDLAETALILLAKAQKTTT